MARSGWKSLPWEAVLPGRKAEPKRGRGYLPSDVSRARLDDCKERLRLLLATEKTFRQLMVALDYYETEIRRALVELGVSKHTRAGFRVPLYVMPSPSAN